MKIVGGKWSNWSGSVHFRPRSVVAPKDEVDLAATVRMAEGRVRFPGSGHSFSPLNQTDGTLIDLAAFGGLKGFDPDSEVASIGAAQPLWGLGSLLHPLGYALDNMGDTDRQTLGGAVATGTHGTGLRYGSLSAAVASFRLLTTTGQVLHCAPDENAEIFAAGRLALGLFGVMTEIDMKVRPVYKLQRRYFQSPAKDILRKLDGLVEANRLRVFLVSAQRNGGLQIAQRNRSACTDTPQRRHALCARRNPAAAGISVRRWYRIVAADAGCGGTGAETVRGADGAQTEGALEP